MSSSSPINPAVDRLADLALWEAELAADPQVVVSSLAGRLEQVPDPRDPRGRQHPLVVVLVLTACATLVVGNDSLTAIWQWAAGTGQDVLARIGARWNGWTGRYLVPSEATFRRVLTLIDGDSLDAAISGYVGDVLAGTASAPVLAAMLGPVEREQRRAVTRQVTHRLRPGCYRPPRLTGNCCTARSPPTRARFWSPRSTTPPAWCWGSGRSRTNAARTPPCNRCCPTWPPASCGLWTLYTRVRGPPG